ncbi:MAG: acyl-CoA dehydrogenase [Notoacmeibacter sp.]|nr:acyl-CoA dehydrogenase [Notoacmeibacter sp.]MCC0031614.1 acyl-CoA dehydrogenase [Brucellaceae bacterium]
MTGLNRDTLDFLVHDWLDAEGLTARPRYAAHSRETFDQLLDLARRMAENEFLPSFKPGDRDEPELKQDGTVSVHPLIAKAVRAYLDAGFQLATIPEAHGGMQMPHLVASAAKAFFQAGNVAAGAYPMLSTGNTRVLLTRGSESLIRHFAEPQLEGRALGTMCLSEPQAGSSLGDITTRAEFECEDAIGTRYRLTGRKMWISGGDHDITPDICHLVLAKIPGPDGKLPAGTRGISIFAVPKRIPAEAEGTDGPVRNDVAVAGLNHKMGYRGTTNCLLNFGEGTAFRPFGKAGAVGYLIGEAGEGLAIMFLMMNEARIGVGLGAAAQAWRGFLLSAQYASERLQGRAPGDRNAEKQVPLVEHADIRRILLAQKAYAEGALALCLYSARLVDVIASSTDGGERDEAEMLLALLTPVNKTFPSEYGPLANSLAIQCHGGYGYTRDFDVEQLYRDNRLNPIHEGTTGIQAMDLLGRKIFADKGAGLKLLAARVGETLGKARNAGGFETEAASLEKALGDVGAAVAAQGGTPETAFANATPLLFAFGHLVVGWQWLDQALAAERAQASGRVSAVFAAGKRAACRYFFDFEMPQIAGWLAPFASGSRAALDASPEIFA